MHEESFNERYLFSSPAALVIIQDPVDLELFVTSMMENFKLQVGDGKSLAGRVCLPPPSLKGDSHLPLVVCVHGGSYDAAYFDMDPEHSVASISQALNIPVVAISRPGYGESTPLPPITDNRSSGEQQGQYLNTNILPALWANFGTRSGATCVVLLAHSIGAMVATIAAGCHTGTEGYTLAGLITSGIGVKHVDESRQGMVQLLGEQTEPILFDSVAKDMVMLQQPHKKIVDPRICIHTERLNKPVPVAELHDINFIWLGHWHKYSHAIKVPVMYGLSEFDGLWVCNPETVQEYRLAFPASPRVECGVIPMAPHCIELSFQSQGWLSRCFGFAWECAVSNGLLVKDG